MDRREAIYNLSVITGLAFLSSSTLLSSCNNSTALKELLDENDIKLLNEIGEVIIPTTAGSPGAKAANTGKYIQAIVHDCMNKEDRQKFMEGWQHMQVLGKEKYEQEIAALPVKEKYTYLTDLDKYSQLGEDKAKSDLAISAFQKIKQLTLKGYFTSEVGATQALRYDPVPGKFVGVTNYTHGDKVWALNM